MRKVKELNPKKIYLFKKLLEENHATKKSRNIIGEIIDRYSF
jgi:hypothetical protein